MHNKKITDINDFFCYLFNLDRLEIDTSAAKIKAVISSGETVKTIYKIFLAYIHEIEKTKNDAESLFMLKKQLAEHKIVFDKYMKETREKIAVMFEHLKLNVELCYEDEFKTVYDKISKFLV